MDSASAERRPAVEFLKVCFREPRRVSIDGMFQGKTGDLIELEAGTYKVSLEPPTNFTPDSVVVVLQGTSALTPREVGFRAA
jgi:hypothetical protein